MVKGLAIFRDRLSAYADHFVLIGGTAASTVMEAASLEFRGTKDLDIVLHVETLTVEFARAFWAFVSEGRYSVREQMERPRLYRFQKPEDDRFPFMLELFSRSPDALPAESDARLTRVSFNGEVSSLSAILLDDDYYAFLRSGRKIMSGLPMIDVDRLIPLKAYAWLDLMRRQGNDERVDTRSIRKHAADVLRLSQLLAASDRFALLPKLQEDLAKFLAALREDDSIDLPSIGIRRIRREELLERIANAYGIEAAETRP